MRILLLTVLSGLSCLQAGCNRRDPAPELKDPLYLELQTRLKEVETDLVAVKAQLQEAEDNLLKVVPQTGQIKYATKRVAQSNERIIKLEQQRKYLEIKIESQKWRAQEEYLTAFYADKPWPSEKPVEDFRTMIKSYQMDRNWSAKARREELFLPVGRQPALAPEPIKAEGQ